MTPFAALVLLAWAATAITAAVLIGRRKGRPWLGFALGLVLGWIGVITIALIPPTRDALIRRERQRLQVQREARGQPY